MKSLCVLAALIAPLYCFAHTGMEGCEAKLQTEQDILNFEAGHRASAQAYNSTLSAIARDSSRPFAVRLTATVIYLQDHLGHSVDAEIFFKRYDSLMTTFTPEEHAAVDAELARDSELVHTLSLWVASEIHFGRAEDTIHRYELPFIEVTERALHLAIGRKDHSVLAWLLKDPRANPTPVFKDIVKLGDPSLIDLAQHHPNYSPTP